jgi:hypothetical protein
MANKNMTIKELEDKKAELNILIAEAIQKFEEDTGTRVGYIDTIRKRDRIGEVDSPMPSFDDDRGDVVSVNVNMNLDF